MIKVNYPKFLRSFIFYRAVSLAKSDVKQIKNKTVFIQLIIKACLSIFAGQNMKLTRYYAISPVLRNTLRLARTLWRSKSYFGNPKNLVLDSTLSLLSIIYLSSPVFHSANQSQTSKFFPAVCVPFVKCQIYEFLLKHYSS